MFDLERELDKWRSELEQSNELGKDSLDELEAHLRDSLEARSADETEEAAFCRSVEALGGAKRLLAEFRKSDHFFFIDYILFGATAVLLGMALVQSSLEVFSDWGHRYARFGIFPFSVMFSLSLGGAYGILRMCFLKREGIVFVRGYRLYCRVLISAMTACIFFAIAILYSRYGLSFFSGPLGVICTFAVILGCLVASFLLLRDRGTGVFAGQVCMGLGVVVYVFPEIPRLLGASDYLWYGAVWVIHVLLMCLPVLVSAFKSKREICSE